MEHSTDGESFSLRTVQKIYQCIFSSLDRRNTALLVSGACHGFVSASVPEGEEEKKMQKNISISRSVVARQRNSLQTAKDNAQVHPTILFFPTWLRLFSLFLRLSENVTVLLFPLSLSLPPIILSPLLFLPRFSSFISAEEIQLVVSVIVQYVPQLSGLSPKRSAIKAHST